MLTREQVLSIATVWSGDEALKETALALYDQVGELEGINEVLREQNIATAETNLKLESVVEVARTLNWGANRIVQTYWDRLSQALSALEDK